MLHPENIVSLMLVSASTASSSASTTSTSLTIFEYLVTTISSIAGVKQELTRLFDGFIVVELLTKLALSEQIGVRVFAWLGDNQLSDWAINATIASNQIQGFIMGLPHPHLDRNGFDMEFTGKLEQYGKNIVFPQQKLSYLICLPLIIWSYLITLLVEQQSFNVSLTRFAFVFTVSVLILLACLFVRQLIMPLRRSMIALEKKIRDDNYLIGKRLVNVNRR